jgi:hypothetical protein
MDVDADRATFRGSPMQRAKLPASKRNAAVVLGNVGTATDTRCSGPGAARSALGRHRDGCGI